MKPVLILFMFAAAIAAQDKPPTISVDLLKNFYAADSQQQRAQRQLEQAQQALQSASQSWKQAVEAMQKVCGEKFQLAQDSVTSDPVCKAKAVLVPVPVAPAVKPTEKK